MNVMTGSCLLALTAAAFAAAPASAAIVVATSSGGGAPGLTVSGTDLLQTAVSSVASTGDFTQADSGSGSAGGLGVLTDGSFGNTANPVEMTVAVAGNQFDRGKSATYTLDTSVATLGYDLTMLDIIGGWNDGGRDAISVEVLYATVTAPATFVSLTTVEYDVSTSLGSTWNRAVVTDDGGLLASGVAAIRFNFDRPVENGWTGYREIDVIGSATAVPEPGALAALAALSAGALLRRRSAR